MHKSILMPALLGPALLGAALFSTSAMAQDTAPSAQSPQSTEVPPSSPAAPAAGASVKASDTIYDPAGNPVGTIEAVNGANAVLSTGTVTVQIPVSAIAQGPKGPTIGVTKAEIEAQVKKHAPPG
jgi:glucose/arabinose dehydrogenase